MTSVLPGFRFAGLVEQRSTSTPGWLAAREGCETMTHGWASGQPGGLPTVNLKWFHGSKGASPLMASAAKAASTFSHSGSSGSCFTSGSSSTMRSLDGRARLTIQVSSSICWTVTGERAGSSGGITRRRRSSIKVAFTVGASHSFARSSSQEAAASQSRAHLDTAPDLAAMAERRSPIRRVSGGCSILAGSETGAPGAVSSCARQSTSPGFGWIIKTFEGGGAQFPGSGGQFDFGGDGDFRRGHDPPAANAVNHRSIYPTIQKKFNWRNGRQRVI